MKSNSTDSRQPRIAVATASAALAVMALGAAAASAAESPTTAVWREHKGSINYFGITSVYTCLGIESKIRKILVYFGARNDVIANARGCNASDMPVGRAMTISVRLFTLVPPDPAATAPAVRAGWSPRAINSNSNSFLANGDCELIDQMHEFIEHNFSLRNLDYRTDCTAHEVNPGSFSVRGEFLTIAKP
jgi:hypothetical protein